MKIQKTILLAMLSLGIIVGCKKEESTDPVDSGTLLEQNPLVSSKSPSSNAISVSRNTTIIVSFNIAMDPSTISSSTLIVMKDTSKIPGVVTYSGLTATFTPTVNLGALTQYTAKITTGAKSLAGKALAATTEWSFTTGGTAATSSLAIVNLGAAMNYVILAKTAINNNPTSSVTGDIGLSPAATSYITGFSLTNATGFAISSQVTGKVYAADMADPTPITLTTSVDNMLTAYNDAAARPSPDFVGYATGNISGKTLLPGLYKWSNTVSSTSDVTLSGGPNDVWIFQVSGDLSISSAVNVILSGGAKAQNIFWQVAGQVTIGTTAHFEGVILSKTSIIMNSGASLTGRALAQTSVTLDGNVVTQP